MGLLDKYCSLTPDVTVIPSPDHAVYAFIFLHSTGLCWRFFYGVELDPIVVNTNICKREGIPYVVYNRLTDSWDILMQYKENELPPHRIMET
jgi:hypothetical protein